MAADIDTCESSVCSNSVGSENSKAWHTRRHYSTEVNAIICINVSLIQYTRGYVYIVVGFITLSWETRRLE